MIGPLFEYWKPESKQMKKLALLVRVHTAQKVILELCYYFILFDIVFYYEGNSKRVHRIAIFGHSNVFICQLSMSIGT
jgi:hypothetical protein